MRRGRRTFTPCSSILTGTRRCPPTQRRRHRASSPHETDSVLRGENLVNGAVEINNKVGHYDRTDPLSVVTLRLPKCATVFTTLPSFSSSVFTASVRTPDASSVDEALALASSTIAPPQLRPLHTLRLPMRSARLLRRATKHRARSGRALTTRAAYDVTADRRAPRPAYEAVWRGSAGWYANTSLPRRAK